MSTANADEAKSYFTVREVLCMDQPIRRGSEAIWPSRGRAVAYNVPQHLRQVPSPSDLGSGISLTHARLDNETDGGKRYRAFLQGPVYGARTFTRFMYPVSRMTLPGENLEVEWFAGHDRDYPVITPVDAENFEKGDDRGGKIEQVTMILKSTEPGSNEWERFFRDTSVKIERKGVQMLMSNLQSQQGINPGNVGRYPTSSYTHSQIIPVKSYDQFFKRSREAGTAKPIPGPGPVQPGQPYEVYVSYAGGSSGPPGLDFESWTPVNVDRHWRAQKLSWNEETKNINANNAIHFTRSFPVACPHTSHPNFEFKDPSTLNCGGEKCNWRVFEYELGLESDAAEKARKALKKFKSSDSREDQTAESWQTECKTEPGEYGRWVSQKINLIPSGAYTKVNGEDIETITIVPIDSGSGPLSNVSWRAHQVLQGDGVFRYLDCPVTGAKVPVSLETYENQVDSPKVDTQIPMKGITYDLVKDGSSVRRELKGDFQVILSSPVWGSFNGRTDEKTGRLMSSSGKSSHRSADRSSGSASPSIFNRQLLSTIHQDPAVRSLTFADPHSEASSGITQMYFDQDTNEDDKDKVTGTLLCFARLSEDETKSLSSKTSNLLRRFKPFGKK